MNGEIESIWLIMLEFQKESKKECEMGVHPSQYKHEAFGF